MFGKIGNFFNKIDAAIHHHHHNGNTQNTHNTQAQYPPQQGQYPPPPPQMQPQYPPAPSDMSAQYPPQPQQGFFPPAPQQAPQFQPSSIGQNPYYNDKRKSAFQKFSRKAGKDNHSNSNYFDHQEQSNLKSAFHNPEVKRITVFHNNNMVLGIEVTYTIATNKNPTTVSSKGSACYGFAESSTIELSFGERIEEISGRAGDSIDRLVIKTSKKQVIEVGGFGGQPFKNIVDGFHPHIKSFGGSTREYLDSIYVIY